jgi:hypothetical protein
MTQEAYNNFREQWTHEDKLINHRLGWLMNSQTILFAVYGVLLGAKVPGTSVPFDNNLLIQIPSMLKLIVKLGCITSLLLWLSVLAAVMALNALRKHAGGQNDPRPLNPGALSFYLGIISPLGLPLVFCAAWLYLKTF